MSKLDENGKPIYNELGVSERSKFLLNQIWRSLLMGISFFGS